MRAISDEAVKALINSGISTDTDADREYVCECIDNIPTIEPKRWEWNKPDYGMCSNCHRYAPETENGFYLSDFCPNCGADMRGKDDE